jgi:hypothetical protein
LENSFQLGPLPELPFNGPNYVWTKFEAHLGRGTTPASLGQGLLHDSIIWKGEAGFARVSPAPPPGIVLRGTALTRWLVQARPCDKVRPAMGLAGFCDWLEAAAIVFFYIVRSRGGFFCVNLLSGAAAVCSVAPYFCVLTSCVCPVHGKGAALQGFSAGSDGPGA